MTDTADHPPIISYKGFDKDFKCRGYQYEVGQTYTHDGEVEACASGFHACPMPMDVFNYYLPVGNRFAVVEQSGETDARDEKVASSRLTVKAEISLPDIIEAQIDWVLSKVDKATSNHNTGDSSVSSATGDSSASSATGYSSASSATGNSSASSATGDRAASLTTGWRAASSVGGSNTVAIATGPESTAKAGEGGWIVMAEWDADSENIVAIRTAQAGVDVEPDIFYRLKDGVFVIAETDDTEE